MNHEAVWKPTRALGRAARCAALGAIAVALAACSGEVPRGEQTAPTDEVNGIGWLCQVAVAVEQTYAELSELSKLPRGERLSSQRKIDGIRDRLTEATAAPPTEPPDVRLLAPWVDAMVTEMELLEPMNWRDDIKWSAAIAKLRRLVPAARMMWNPDNESVCDPVEA